MLAEVKGTQNEIDGLDSSHLCARTSPGIFSDTVNKYALAHFLVFNVHHTLQIHLASTKCVFGRTLLQLSPLCIWFGMWH